MMLPLASRKATRESVLCWAASTWWQHLTVADVVDLRLSSEPDGSAGGVVTGLTHTHHMLDDVFTVELLLARTAAPLFGASLCSSLSSLGYKKLHHVEILCYAENDHHHGQPLWFAVSFSAT